MKQSDDLGRFGVLIASSASSSDIATVPATQTTAGDGTASIALGFPPETFIARAAGGVPPRGQDMNGLLNRISRAIQILQAGYLGPFDATFAAAIGGYPAGAIVSGSVAGTFWVSTADANTTVPGATGANWKSLFDGYSTQSVADKRYLMLASTATQTVTGPVSFAGTTTVPSVTDWTSKQAVPASDADGRYATQTALTAETTRATTVERNLQSSKVSSAGDIMTGSLTIQGTYGNPTGYSWSEVLAVVNTAMGSSAQFMCATQYGSDTAIRLKSVWGGGKNTNFDFHQSGRISSDAGDVAFVSDLPFATAGTKVQIFNVTIPAGTLCGYSQGGYLVTLPSAFSNFLGAWGNDINSAIYTPSIAIVSNSQFRLWAQSPQATSGVTGPVGPITIRALAIGIP